MSRRNELFWNMGFNVLMPRFCLFVLLPGLVAAATAPHWPPLAWAEGMIVGCLLVFGVSVAANLGISRYLRIHETPESPYTYAYWYVSSRRNSYFRIQVSDKKAFWRLLRELRRDHPREAVGQWLSVEEVLYTPPILLVSLLPLLLTALVMLGKFVGSKLTKGKPRPEM